MLKSLTIFLSCIDPYHAQIQKIFPVGVHLQTRVRVGPASDQRGSDNVA